MCGPTTKEASVAQKTGISEGVATATAEVVKNEKWVLASRPNGIFDDEKDVKFVVEELTLKDGCCKIDEVIIKTDMLSVDAFIRTMLDEEAYHGSIPIDGTIPAIGYGKIVYAGSESGHKVGSTVQGSTGAQTYATVKGKEVLAKFDLPFMTPSASLGLLGLTTGLTAYAGIYYVANKPKKGETVVVTAAAGAVGSIASQLAKSTGARVIGIAGGEKKQRFLLDNLKLDGAIDYKHSTKTVSNQIDELCPNGIDFIYDNVGGEILDDLLMKINPKGRVIICGAISQYSGKLNKGLVRGPSNYLKLAERGATMKGFNVMQYISKVLFMLFGMWWMALRGKVTMKEHTEYGIESFPKALKKLFTGGHMGKMVVSINSNNGKSKTE